MPIPERADSLGASPTLGSVIPKDADPYARALQALEDEDLGNARTYLAEAERAHTVSEDKLLACHARIAIASGNFLEAVRWYKKALLLAPTDSDLLAEAGWVAFATGDLSASQTWLKCLLGLPTASANLDEEERSACTLLLVIINLQQSSQEDLEPILRTALDQLPSEHSGTNIEATLLLFSLGVVLHLSLRVRIR